MKLNNWKKTNPPRRITRLLSYQVTILLIGLISLAFAQVGTAPPDVQVEVWYYLSPDSAVMEVWGQGDQKPDTDPGEWKEVTLEELHSKDIYSPSENETRARTEGTVSEGETGMDGYYILSFITKRTVEGQKQIILGSKTSRSWYCPGKLRTWGTAYCQGVAYDSGNSGWKWGWIVYWQARLRYETQIYYWRQEGGHAFKVGDAYHTTASGYY